MYHHWLLMLFVLLRLLFCVLLSLLTVLADALLGVLMGLLMRLLMGLLLGMLLAMLLRLVEVGMLLHLSRTHLLLDRRSLTGWAGLRCRWLLALLCLRWAELAKMRRGRQSKSLLGGLCSMSQKELALHLGGRKKRRVRGGRDPSVLMLSDQQRMLVRLVGLLKGRVGLLIMMVLMVGRWAGRLSTRRALQEGRRLRVLLLLLLPVVLRCGVGVGMVLVLRALCYLSLYPQISVQVPLLSCVTVKADKVSLRSPRAAYHRCVDMVAAETAGMLETASRAIIC